MNTVLSSWSGGPARGDDVHVVARRQAAPVEFLDTLTPRMRAELLALGRPAAWDCGAVLLRAGERSCDVVLLRRGVVKATRETTGRDVLLGLRGPGAALGARAALDATSNGERLTALSVVDAVVVSAVRFRGFLAARPAAALAFARTLSARLDEADRVHAERALGDALGRVAARLLELAAYCGECGEQGTRIDAAFSQEELASWVGTTRETVARALRVMRATGWVATSRGTIVVRDPAALQRRAA